MVDHQLQGIISYERPPTKKERKITRSNFRSWNRPWGLMLHAAYEDRNEKLEETSFVSTSMLHRISIYLTILARIFSSQV
jgi:hypothetical protein